MIRLKNLHSIYPSGLTYRNTEGDYKLFECIRTGQLVILWDNQFWPTSKMYIEVEWITPQNIRRENGKMFLLCALLGSQKKQKEVIHRIRTS